MKFSLSLQLDSYCENIIHEITIATHVTNSPTSHVKQPPPPTFLEGKLLHEEYMRRVCVALELYTTVS